MQRYYLRTDPSYSPTMLPSPDGPWVGFADAESELSTLRARVAELEQAVESTQQDSAKIRRVAIRDLQREHLDRSPAGTLLCYWTPASRTVVVTGTPVGDEHNCDAMGCSQEHVVERIDIGALESRLAALEAPPVVPRGWAVTRNPHYVEGWRIGVISSTMTEAPLPTVTPAGDRSKWIVELPGKSAQADWESRVAIVYRALAWAVENDARPPHESDGEVTL